MKISKTSSTESTGQPVESDDVLYIEISAKTGQNVKEVCMFEHFYCKLYKLKSVYTSFSYNDTTTI